MRKKIQSGSFGFQGPMGLRGESGRPGEGKAGAMVRSRISRF